MTLTTCFFDLDDTLYPASSGLWHAIRQRISLYMVERMGMTSAHADELRQAYYLQYGTALRGLLANYPVDEAEFLAYVHDVPLADFIQPDPALRPVLQALPGRKFIFTNADVNHARRVLTTLELSDCFDGIIDVVALTPYCKPMPESFEIALRMAGENDPKRCLLVDDMARTTRAARSLGIYSILFGASAAGEDADVVLNDWTELPKLLNGRL